MCTNVWNDNNLPLSVRLLPMADISLCIISETCFVLCWRHEQLLRHNRCMGERSFVCVWPNEEWGRQHRTTGTLQTARIYRAYDRKTFRTAHMNALTRSTIRDGTFGMDGGVVACTCHNRTFMRIPFVFVFHVCNNSTWMPNCTQRQANAHQRTYGFTDAGAQTHVSSFIHAIMPCLCCHLTPIWAFCCAGCDARRTTHSSSVIVHTSFYAWICVSLCVCVLALHITQLRPLAHSWYIFCHCIVRLRCGDVTLADR